MRVYLSYVLVFLCLCGCGRSSNQPAEPPKDPVLENPHGNKPSGPPDLSVLSERHKKGK
jgi:hypothetical protein